ncbi:Uncharacterised protein [Streptococcus pneumoniae]|nr:Uncharacterised protein [Streptococcus pneumoniae]
MNNKQVYQAQTTDHGIARALGEEIRMITDVEETTYNGHGEIIVEYTSDVALTKLFDRIKALYEKGESYETKTFLHFKVLEDDIEPSPKGAKTWNWFTWTARKSRILRVRSSLNVLESLITQYKNF